MLLEVVTLDFGDFLCVCMGFYLFMVSSIVGILLWDFFKGKDRTFLSLGW